MKSTSQAPKRKDSRATHIRITSKKQKHTRHDACPTCGTSMEEWAANKAAGIQQGGVTFCCQDCAKGNGCSCAN